MSDFDYSKLDLPIVHQIPKLKKALEQHESVILQAEPGAGKSTLIPLALLNEKWLGSKKIIMLEPRRLAAKAIAARLASLLNEPVGETVGYRIRFEQKVSNLTKIEVVTEGILTRMLQTDSSLTEVGIVIFDEFHERSIHADLSLALCREAQQVLRPDLKLLIMSATLDLAKLGHLLEAPLLQSEGRQYPVEIRYGERADPRFLPELMASTIQQAASETEGDILAFFPGEHEIAKCSEILSSKNSKLLLMPLYGRLSPEAQWRAIFPNKEGKRRVVLATSIAETSLTIEGIKVVIDSGYSRVSRFDARSGLTRLETVTVSLDTATQRSGRAGRLSSGIAYRLWSKADEHRMTEHRTPEILEADLCSLVLELACWGNRNPNHLLWLNPPPEGHVVQARQILHDINALEQNLPTEHGKKLRALPCHPRIANMLFKAEKDQHMALAADIAGVLEERDPLGGDRGVDLNLRIESLRRYRQQQRKQPRWDKIAQIAATYRKWFDVAEDNSNFDPFEVGLLLAHIYPERIASARPGNNAQFQLANGRIAALGHQDTLANEPWLCVASMDARDGLGKIFLAAPINPKDLLPLVKIRKETFWDQQKQQVVAYQQLALGSIVLKSTRIQVEPDLAAAAIIDAFKKQGFGILEQDEHAQQWINRYNLWQYISGNAKNDDNLSIVKVVQAAEEWLLPWINGMQTFKELSALPLFQILGSYYAKEKMEQFEKEMPAHLQLPAGVNTPIFYGAVAEEPYCRVKIQQVFGMKQSPQLANGKVKLVFQLLSPASRPVQITKDLKSFWLNTYPVLVKELKRNYPKHFWPDNPLEEQPLKGSIKRREL